MQRLRATDSPLHSISRLPVAMSQVASFASRPRVHEDLPAYAPQVGGLFRSRRRRLTRHRLAAARPGAGPSEQSVPSAHHLDHEFARGPRRVREHVSRGVGANPRGRRSPALPARGPTSPQARAVERLMKLYFAISRIYGGTRYPYTLTARQIRVAQSPAVKRVVPASPPTRHRVGGFFRIARAARMRGRRCAARSGANVRSPAGRMGAEPRTSRRSASLDGQRSPPESSRPHLSVWRRSAVGVWCVRPDSNRHGIAPVRT